MCHNDERFRVPARKSPLAFLVGVLQSPLQQIHQRLDCTARRPKVTSSSRCRGRGEVVEEPNSMVFVFALMLLRPFRSFHPSYVGSFITHGPYCNLSLRHGSTTRNSTLRTRTSRYPNRVRGEVARGLRPEARGLARHEISCQRRAKRVFRPRCCFYATLTQVRNSSPHAFFFLRASV